MNRNGILNFFHDHLRQAVEKKYLDSAEAKKKGYLKLADYFGSKETSSRTVRIYIGFSRTHNSLLFKVFAQVTQYEQ